MDLNVDDFFELLLDQDPCYLIDIEEVYDDRDQIIEINNILSYKEFNSPGKYKSESLKKGLEIIYQFNIDIDDNGKVEYLKNRLERLKLELKNFSNIIINNYEFPCHNYAYVNDYYKYISSEKKEDLKSLSEWKIKEFIAYNQYRIEIIQFVIEKMESLLSISNVEPPIGLVSKGNSKLVMSISVSDIALLFRLLDEEGILDYKHRTEIYRFISSCIQSLNQDQISEASIKNKFLSPDNTAISNIDALLVNLRQRLKKIQ